MEAVTWKEHARRWLEVLPYVIVFLAVFAAGLIMYHAAGIRPFGDQCIVAMDMYSQYFPMYVMNTRDTLFSDAFYSWCGAFGFNNWAQNAYYCLSIFFLPLRFVRTEHMVDALCWIGILKPACSAVTALGFFRYKAGRFSPLLMGGAAAYGLTVYMLSSISQMMWTDCVIYAPLVLLGLERILDGKRPLLYTLMLAVLVISNFYIAFSVCLFLVLYFLVRTVPAIFAKDGGGFRKFLVQTGKFAGYSVLAGCLTAAVILPVWLALRQTLASELEAPDALVWYQNIFVQLQQLLPGAPLVYGYDFANIAVGLLVFLTVPLYFCNKSFSVGERIANGVLLVFLILSLNCNLLNYLWHGFHFPNMFPARWSFLLSLYLLLLGTLGAVRLEGLSLLRTGIGVATGIILLLLTCIAPGSGTQKELPAIGWVVLICGGVLLLGASVLYPFQAKEADSVNPLARRGAFLCMALLTVLQITDSTVNFRNTAKLPYPNGLRMNDASSYSEGYVQAQSRVRPYLPQKDEFWRISDHPGITYNPCMAGVYPGLSAFSSTMSGDVFTLMRYMGDTVHGNSVRSVWHSGSAVKNGLFGVRYILGTQEDAYSQTAPLDSGSETAVYENPTALPLAYAVSEAALDLPLSADEKAIRNQQALLDAALGRSSEVFTRIAPDEFTYENCEITASDNWDEQKFIRYKSANSVSFHYSYRVPQDGELYLENNFRTGKLYAAWDGHSREIDGFYERYCCLGTFRKGDTVTLDITLEDASGICWGAELYSFDNDKWQAAFETLNARSLQLETFRNTSFSGTIDLDADSLVMATIPQDGGWKVLCDGKPLDTVKAFGTLAAVRVPAGEHTLTYRYTVPGIIPGGILSGTALLVLIWLAFPALRQKLGMRSAK